MEQVRSSSNYVVLVHGTFATGAPWTQPGKSSLCKRLTKSFGNDVEFEAFAWSGENRHSARLAAGVKLADRLEEIIARQGGQGLYLIGHSHGGTVITHALRHNPRVARAIEGVIFLSTPFIQMRRRPHGGALAGLIAFMLFVFTFLVSNAINDLLLGWSWPGWLASLTSWAVLMGLIMGLLALAFEPDRPKASDKIASGRRPKKPRTDSRLDAGIEKLRSEFSVENLDRHRTLIIRANADEASAALAWVQAVSRLIGDLAAWPLRLFRVLDSGRGNHQPAPGRQPRNFRTLLSEFVTLFLLLYVVFFLLVMIVNGVVSAVEFIFNAFGIDISSWYRATFPTVAIVTGGLLFAAINALAFFLVPTVFVMLVFGAVLVAVSISLMAFNRAFGRWFIFTALFVEVSVESAPPGRWMVYQLDPTEPDRKSRSSRVSGLMHSLSYEDPRSLRLIASWIRLGIRSRGRADGRRTGAR